MDKSTARNLCMKNSASALAQYMTHNELLGMYQALYGIPSRNKGSKLDIAYACWNFVQDEIRTADLCKILR